MPKQAVDGFQYDTIRFVEALMCGEVLPHCQPVIDLQSGGIHSWELLARWVHPDFGILYPACFVASVKKDSLDVALALTLFEWGLKWRPVSAAARLAVNVGGAGLAEPGLGRYFQQIAARYGCDLSALILEVSEADIVSNLDAARRNLLSLKQLGCAISIDDYGAGYADRNLRDLMPVDTVKLDQSLIGGVRHCKEKRERLQGDVARFRQLGLEIVAEGVGDVVDVENCRAMGIGLGQGFGLSYGGMFF